MSSPKHNIPTQVLQLLTYLVTYLNLNFDPLEKKPPPEVTFGASVDDPNLDE